MKILSAILVVAVAFLTSCGDGDDIPLGPYGGDDPLGIFNTQWYITDSDDPNLDFLSDEAYIEFEEESGRIDSDTNTYKFTFSEGSVDALGLTFSDGSLHGEWNYVDEDKTIVTFNYYWITFDDEGNVWYTMTLQYKGPRQ